jgi:hypothetical protein
MLLSERVSSGFFVYREHAGDVLGISPNFAYPTLVKGAPEWPINTNRWAQPLTRVNYPSGGRANHSPWT